MRTSTTARIRRVSAHMHHADSAWGLARERHCWVVEWCTPLMPAPSFWYYGTRKAARTAARSLRGTS